LSYCILQNETWYLAEDIIFTRLPIIKYRANKTTRSVSSQFHQVQYITHISQIVKQLVIRDSLVCLSFPQLTHYYEDNYCARPVCATTVITHYIPTMLFQSVVVTSSIVISLKTSLANFNPETLTDVRGSIPGRGRVIPKTL